MTRRGRARAVKQAGVSIITAAAAMALCGSAAASVSSSSGYQLRVFATGGRSLTNPDDITSLEGVVYVVYQNDTNPDGTPANATSTVVGYRPDGSQTGTWSVVGHCDGLTADPSHHRLIATVNEDANSSLYTITPKSRPADQLRHYSYSPDPSSLSGGGTDAISVLHGRIFISASNPSPSTTGGTTFTGPAVYAAKIPVHGSVVSLKPTFYDNSQATDAVSGQAVALNLSDPDSNAIVPGSSPRFAGDFVLDSQGDSELVFAHHPGTGDQSLTRLSLKSGNGAPQVDDVTWATERGGVLLAVDAKQDQIDAISGPFASGSALTAIPGDSQALPGDLGTIDLATGTVTPFATGFGSPKGLLYLPRYAGGSERGDRRGGSGADHRHGRGHS